MTYNTREKQFPFLVCCFVFVIIIHASCFSQSQWTVQNQIDIQLFRAITYGNGFFIASGFYGTWISAEGVAWKAATTDNFFSIAFGADRFAAISGSSMYTSPDGKKWTKMNIDTSYRFNSVTFCGGMFIALGNQGLILYSRDAVTWTPAVSNTQHSLYSVAFGDSIYTVVGSDVRLISNDGSAWIIPNNSIVTKIDTWDKDSNGICFGNGLFVRYGKDNFEYGIHNEIIFAQGLFVHVGLYGSISTSTDGVNWTPVNSQTQSPFYSITFGNNKFVAVGGGTIGDGRSWPGVIDISNDGINWSPDVKLTSQTFNGSIYGDSQFVAVGDSGIIATSGKGGKWLLRKSSTITALNSIVYAKSRYVAVGDKGIVLISPDADTWTVVSSGTTNALRSIAFGNNRFITIGYRGTILASLDGAAWKIKNQGTLEYLRSITYANDQFVAVGYGDTILTSSDGDTWKVKKSGVSEYLYSVTYGEGQFVAVGGSGTILSSTDGSVWSRKNISPDYWLESIFYGNGRFVAVGSQGMIIASPDGSTWIKTDSGNTDLLCSISEGNNIFLAVGGNGVIMTSPFDSFKLSSKFIINKPVVNAPKILLRKGLLKVLLPLTCATTQLQVALFSAAGKRMFQASFMPGNNPIAIPTAALPPGKYFISIKNKSKVLTVTSFVIAN